VNAPQLWEIFLTANIPDANLVALGDDLGHKRDLPSSVGLPALLALTEHIRQATGDKSLKAAAVFHVMKSFMPGVFLRRDLLECMAREYRNKTPYARLHPDTQTYLAQIASRLPALPSSKNPPSSTTPKAPSTLPSLSGEEAIKIKHALRNVTKVHDNDIAEARNYASRAGMTHTVAAFENEIARRRADKIGEAATTGRTFWGGLAIFTAGFFSAILYQNWKVCRNQGQC